MGIAGDCSNIVFEIRSIVGIVLYSWGIVPKSIGIVVNFAGIVF